MNIIIKSILFVFLFSTAIAKESSELFPSLDLKLPTPLPKAFRIPTQEYAQTQDATPTKEGLDQIHISASGQFYESNLLMMLERLQKNNISVIDLREESHGFVNGLPISWKLPYTSWTNMNKTLEAIEKDENLRLKKLFEKKLVVLDPKTRPLKLDVHSTYSEKQLVQRYRLGYIRIPITENHPPVPARVDQIVKLILNQKPDEWFHVHCHGGRGRTTTFMIMADMLLNGKKVSFDDILKRHVLLGGTDMQKTVETKSPKFKSILTRGIFLKRFYRYVNEADPHEVAWSEWIKTNHQK